MRRISTLLFALLATLTLPAQVVLNEIYADPSPGNSEFFELYNTSSSGSPVSMDGITIISYFESGNKKGFNVIDLPNISIAPLGYVVGSASMPFNYQGNLGSTSADFSWNDPSLTLNGGYIKRWVATGNTAVDGTGNYVEETVPAGFNDFFSRQVGSGASYNAFVFKNGVLVNAFIGGTGGGTKMPAYITAMPTFPLENATVSGSNPYTIAWGTFGNTKPEFVTQDIGTDNGFIRKRDGMCGTWVKSSSTVQHTPKVSNGGSQMDTDGELTIDTHIYPSTNLADPPFVVYNITDGPAELFPVELLVYADNGTVPGELDAKDTFVEAATENSLSDGPFKTFLPTPTEDVLVVAKTAAGCFDQILFVRNTIDQMSTLPMQLKLFTGKMNGGKALLEWVVSANEEGQYFQILKSEDGKNYTVADVVPASPQAGEAYYTYSAAVAGKQYFKLNVVSKNNSQKFSPVVFIEPPVSSNENRLTILQNPVRSALAFTYRAAEAGACTIGLYNAMGVCILRKELTLNAGTHHINLQLSSRLGSGLYVLEVAGTTTRTAKRFVKQ